MEIVKNSRAEIENPNGGNHRGLNNSTLSLREESMNSILLKVASRQTGNEKTTFTKDFNNFIFEQNGRPVTTSLDVALVFDKRHDNVLRTIKKLNCSEDFTRLNFEFSEYIDETGRKLPMYTMTKNGFMFLVMGFTGKKAAMLKEGYIEAFDYLLDKIRLDARAAEKEYYNLSFTIDNVTYKLSDCGRFLCVGGKHIKPALLKRKQELEEILQPSLPLIGGV